LVYGTEGSLRRGAPTRLAAKYYQRRLPAQLEALSRRLKKLPRAAGRGESLQLRPKGADLAGRKPMLLLRTFGTAQLPAVKQHV
jgi:hypothetical protein